MTERTIDYLPLDQVQPAPRNPKGHAEDDLGASIERWGFTEAPLLDERTGCLVAGHGRLQAPKRIQFVNGHDGATTSANFSTVLLGRGARADAGLERLAARTGGAARRLG